jgi:hypothetical protein
MAITTHYKKEVPCISMMCTSQIKMYIPQITTWIPQITTCMPLPLPPPSLGRGHGHQQLGSTMEQVPLGHGPSLRLIKPAKVWE